MLIAVRYSFLLPFLLHASLAHSEDTTPLARPSNPRTSPSHEYTNPIARVLFSKNGVLRRLKRAISRTIDHLLYAYSTVFTKQGIKDLTLSYALSLIFTTVHELGHASAANYLHTGIATNQEIGIGASHKRATQMKSPLFSVAGIKFWSLSPFQGAYAYTEVPISENTNLKNALIAFAGPAAQALGSYLIFILLKKYTTKYPISQAYAAYHVFSATLGMYGLMGFDIPGHDFYDIHRVLRRWYQDPTSLNDPYFLYDFYTIRRLMQKRGATSPSM